MRKRIIIIAITIIRNAPSPSDNPSAKAMSPRERIVPYYIKCPKILNSKVSDKMTCVNSADPDQTAPEGAVWSGSTLFAIPLSILRNNCIKNKT